MSIKTLTSIVTAIFAATFFISTTAQAGCGGHRGFSKNYSYSASYKAKKRAKARAIARARARAKAKARAIAKAKAKQDAQRLAETKTESNFVETKSTAALLTDGDVKKDKKTEEPNQKIAKTNDDTASKTVIASSETSGCKRFVPAVGRTITVSCE